MKKAQDGDLKAAETMGKHEGFFQQNAYDVKKLAGGLGGEIDRLQRKEKQLEALTQRIKELSKA